MPNEDLIGNPPPYAPASRIIRLSSFSFSGPLGCKGSGSNLVAGLADRDDVVESALPSSFDDGFDVLGVPEG